MRNSVGMWVRREGPSSAQEVTTGRLVSIHHKSTKRNGKQLDVYCCIVFEVKDGLRVLLVCYYSFFCPRLMGCRETGFELHQYLRPRLSVKRL